MIITQARAIGTNDTGAYGWANLRRFQNVSFVESEIIRLHQLAPRWHRDAHKQATQLRYCLTQAREYSSAATAVTLATKPTLLYYSLMSLALAEILLKQSGLSSLDKARAEHRHHGLVFQHQAGPSVRGKPLTDAAAELRAVPMTGSEGQTGTFHLWHNSSREMPIAGVLTNHLPNGNNSACQTILGSFDAPLSPIPDTGLSLLDCLFALPGLMEHLAMQGLFPGTLRARVSADVYPQDTPPRRVFTIIVHPSILATEFFANTCVAPSWIYNVDLVELPGGGLLTIRSDELGRSPSFILPHGTPWTEQETRFWPHIMPLNEFGYLYVALFIAGNYARYFPDKWLLDVETCSPLALAIEELVSVAEQRMSWLALSELSRVCFVTH